MIKLSRYTTTQISTTFGAGILLMLAIVGFSSLSVFKLLFYIIGSYILSLEIAAILFAMRLPRKFYKKFVVEPLYSVNIVILGLYTFNAIRTSEIVSLPFVLPALAAILVALQLAYYKWFAAEQAPGRRPKKPGRT